MGTNGGHLFLISLVQQTITVTIEGSDLHLISYYTSDDIRSGKLKVRIEAILQRGQIAHVMATETSTRSDIVELYMPPHIFRLTNFRVPPKVDIGPDRKPRQVHVFRFSHSRFRIER